MLCRAKLATALRKPCDPHSGPRKRVTGVRKGLGVEEIGDALAERFHVGGAEATCRCGGDAEAQSGPLRGASRIERDRVSCLT